MAYTVDRSLVWLGGQTNEQTNKQTDKQTNKQTDKQTNKQANKQTNKQTNKWLARQRQVGMRAGSRHKWTTSRSSRITDQRLKG